MRNYFSEIDSTKFKNISLSIGGYILKDNNVTYKEALKMADNELYKNKRKWHKDKGD